MASAVWGSWLVVLLLVEGKAVSKVDVLCEDEDVSKVSALLQAVEDVFKSIEQRGQ